MPRGPRVKNDIAIYHIIVRSIKELYLFKDNKDKNKYLSLIRKYQIQYNFSIYTYCLMTNHGHFIIYANGSDISQVMHSINQSYAQYFNKKYKRYGHVFQNRFKSIIVTNDRYLFNLSAYIHNNPIDIKRYKNCVEKYKYSSLGVFLGIKQDDFKILDEDFISHLFNKNIKKARNAYVELVYACNRKMKKNRELESEKNEYRSEKIIIHRGYTPEEILKFIVKYTKMEKWEVLLKYNRRNTKIKALYVFLMRSIGNLKQKDICKILGNMTQSRISKLCSIGIDIVEKNTQYKNVISDFLSFQSN